MNINAVHYAPHHNGHLPLCGAEPDRATNGGLVICTMERDSITCFKCLDQYEERAMTPEQVAALDQIRDDIDDLFNDVQEHVLFDHAKDVTLHAMDHMIRSAPWWAFRYKFRIARAMTELRELALSDFK